MISVVRIRTLMRLGLFNLLRVGLYRFGLKTGLHPALRIKAMAARGPYFRRRESSAKGLPEPNRRWDDSLWWFDWYREDLPDDPPNWFYNPFSDAPQPNASLDWWKIPDFGHGDIKGLWELSRFSWVVAWATKVAHGDDASLFRLNRWIEDWSSTNPPYKGPNWKCGQEASIRVLHLIVAAWLLDQDRNPEKGLVALIVTHLRRIAPTISYAIGQQNNHGTTEAAALFIGGSFLTGHHERAEEWEQMGRKWLEDRAARLIEVDGSFSQYSVVYHRLMMDCYSLAEAWRLKRKLPAFSDRLVRRLSAAAGWLATLVDPLTGDAPNLGANDGARLLPLTSGGYRDFRPCVQLGAALFEKRDAFGDGQWSEPLDWLGLKRRLTGKSRGSVTFNCGGFHVLRMDEQMALLRYPRFRFRPSQADALHVDLWVKGHCLLSDAGTFSYNAQGSEWFASTAAHNTICFDNRDQMPRLSRFLFADWLLATEVAEVSADKTRVCASAGYSDRFGAHHHRRVWLEQRSFFCLDTISGVFNAARLHWRLRKDDWVVVNNTLTNGSEKIAFFVDDEIVAPMIGTTRESRFYQNEEEAFLIYIPLNRPVSIMTKVSF